ncbi:MAG: 3-hydroxyacyl-CoA dehydrogenase NAD-binding domain-containing protein [Peptococcaceae bacterium]|nr:3-hydroxyacyl-CoA dehydrogenase NAD-binding domain-containing protein [Peptococcaceae bacterium]
MKAKEKIAIVGAGLMGGGIAQIFASKNHRVALFDTQAKSLSLSVENMRKNLSLMADNGIDEAESIESTLGNIRTTMQLAEAVEDADLVIECAPENATLKQSIFAELDSLCPVETILASNTSVISITEIAQKSHHRERILGTHFWNPPYLIPLVEVIKTEHTAPEVFERTFSLLQAVGKHPVRVNKDVPGFVANRLQHALWREAISIVERGIADASTVDECIRNGFGLRLPVLAPLENSDMVGADLTLAIHDYILKHIESSTEPSPLLKEKVAKGELGFKTGKGFFTWSQEDIEKSRTRLIEHLLTQLKTRH